MAVLNKAIHIFICAFSIFYTNQGISQCISPDSIKPVIRTKTSLILFLDNGGKTTLSSNNLDSGSTDNCTQGSKLNKKFTFGSQVNVNTVNFSCSDIGIKSIIYLVSDSSGNLSSKTIQISVKDTISPKNLAKLTITKNLDGQGLTILNLSDIDNSSSDNCTPFNSLNRYFVYQGQSNLSSVKFNCNNIGVKNVVYTVTDANNNSTSVKIEVTIIDATKPVIVAKTNLTKQLNNSGSVTLSLTELENGTYDNCSNSGKISKTLSYGAQTNVSALNFSCTDLGNKTVSFNASDSSGNNSNTSVSILILDTISPKISANLSITKSLSNSGLATLVVSEVENNSTDNCTSNSGLTKYFTYGGQTNLTSINFSCSDLGVKTLIYNIRDASNNVSNVKVSVKLVDNINPSIVSSNNIVKYLDASGQVTVSVSDVENGSTDNCTINSKLIKTLSYGNQTNLGLINLDCDDIGIKQLTYRIEDEYGNVSNSQIQFTIKDTIRPKIKANVKIDCYLDANGLTTVSTSNIENGSADNCTESSKLIKSLTYGNTQNKDFISLSCDNIGMNKFTYQVVDKSGNTANIEISVSVWDTIKPRLILKSPVLYFPNNLNKLWISKDMIDSQSYDNCNLKFSFIPSYLTNNNLGTNLIRVKCTDSSGNWVADYASIELKDTTRPYLKVRKNINLYLNKNGYAQLANFANMGIGQDSSVIITFGDNCDLNPQIVLSKNYFFASDLNNTSQKVLVTISDRSGNVHVDFVNVTVRDTIKPIIRLKRFVNFKLENNGLLYIAASQLDSGSTDNSNFLKLSLNKNNLTCSDLGKQTIKFTAVDQSGNIATDSVVIYVHHQNAYGTIRSKINLERIIHCKDYRTAKISTEIEGGIGPYRTSWKRNNVALSYDNLLNIDSLGAGNYKVEITDVNFCTKTDSIIITEPNVVLPTIYKSGDTSICEGNSVTLIASGGTKYTWYTSANNLFSNSPILVVNPRKSMNYKVQVVDNNGCKNIDSIQIQVNPLPDIRIESTVANLCKGENMILKAKGGLGFKYAWSPMNLFLNNKLETVNPYFLESTKIELIGIDLNGCQNRDSLLITVNEPPQIQISQSDSICPGSNIKLSVFGGDIINWVGPWLDNTNIRTPIATPIKTTKYYVKVESLKKCSTLDSVTIHVIDKPKSSNVSGNMIVCQNSSWNNYKVEQNYSVNRSWTLNNGKTEFVDNNQIFVNWKTGVEGQIFLKERSTQYPYCETDQTINVKFTKNSSLPKSIIFIKSNNVNSNILISDLKNAPVTVWGYESKLNFDEIVTCENANWCKYPFIDTFRYRYWVKMGDSINCLQKSYLNAPNMLGTDFPNAQQFQLYPNPAVDFVCVSGTTNLLNVNVYNSLGVKVLASTEDFISIDGLASGIYIFELINKNGIKENHRIYVNK
jgi:hypothetical protein